MLSLSEPGEPISMLPASSQKAVQTQTQASRLRKSHAIRTAQIRPNIANPVGLLIRALPSRCAAESIANYRDHWRKEDDQEKRRREQERAQTRETARSILDGVSRGEQWDNDTIEWAKSILTNDHASTAAR